jgi:selenocysteine-specific elongation factor
MQVVATAGHVDHGKSTLVRALTGMEPDRWDEERRRGLTIDLGFAWTGLPGGQRIAFVDVPGHERFVPNMLAGLGPVPAVLMVVAADGGWMPQSAEHLAAIDALGISRGLLAITRADLADPGPSLRRATAEIAATSLGTVEAVPVSAVTGAGLPELRDALVRLAGTLPVPDPGAPVRLWVDRAFSIKGSGTVVTGTLPAGTVRTGDELLLTPAMRPVRVRGIESLREPAERISGVARVALNLRGVAREIPARGMALVQAGGWTLASVIDVRLGAPATPPAPARPQSGTAAGRLPRELILHIGSARTAARVRVLGAPGAGNAAGAAGPVIARLMLRDPLPLHVGDRVLLRDPGPGEPVILGATVLDVIPPLLGRRGAAAAAARELADWPVPPGAADLLRRHGLLRAGMLAAMGAAGCPEPVTGDWAADPRYWAGVRQRLAAVVAEHAEREPLAPGMPVEAARAALDLPDRRLVEALARPAAGGPGAAPAVSLDRGYLRAVPPAAPGGAQHEGARDSTARDSAARDSAARDSAGARPAPVPEAVLRAIHAVRSDLAGEPFRAPGADRLRELGLDARAIAAAARAGLLLRVSEQVVLAPGADAEAAQVLARLPQPFSTAEAREALGTTRRVAIPLLEFLDRARITERLPDDRRRLRPR